MIDHQTFLNLIKTPLQKWICKIYKTNTFYNILCDISFRGGDIADLQRIDCFPERLGKYETLTKEKCELRNCIYNSTRSEAPDCHFPMTEYGYSVSGAVTNTQNGWRVPLKWKGKSPFGAPINDLVFEIESYGDAVFRFKVCVYLPMRSVLQCVFT